MSDKKQPAGVEIDGHVFRLVARVEYLGWKLKRPNQYIGRHWRAAKSHPEVENWVYSSPAALVGERHPRRLVRIVRTAPRVMDEDSLYASVKPVLDRIKRRKIRVGPTDHVVAGMIYDDSPKYCKLQVVQRRGKVREYSVWVEVFADVREKGVL